MDDALPPASVAPHVDRRRMLQGLAALVASGYVPAGFAQSATAPLAGAKFSAMSTTLTGYAYKDPAVADSLLRALSTTIGAQNLARIADLAATVPPPQLGAALIGAGLETAAATVVAALYSGVVETAKGPLVLTYDQALAWQAVPWTKPNAWCGGPTNYWSADPMLPPAK